MIKQIAHVCIRTDNLERTEWFYCTVLGCVKKFDFIKNNAVFGFYLTVGGNTHIEVFKDTPAPDLGTIKHICLAVDSIDTVRAKLIEHDIAVTEKTLGADGSWQIWCKDPNDVDIELHEYTDKSAQVTGEDVVVG